LCAGVQAEVIVASPTSDTVIVNFRNLLIRLSMPWQFFALVEKKMSPPQADTRDITQT
jgi:hypothetical protein